MALDYVSTDASNAGYLCKFEVGERGCLIHPMLGTEVEWR